MNGRNKNIFLLILKVFSVIIILTGSFVFLPHYITFSICIFLLILANVYILRCFFKIKVSFISFYRLILKEFSGSENEDRLQKLNIFRSKTICQQSSILIDTIKSIHSGIVMTNHSMGNLGLMKEVIIFLNNMIYEIDNEKELFTKVIETGIETIGGADAGSLLILTEGNLLEFTASVGFNHDVLAKTYLKLDECYLWKESKGKLDKSYVIHNKEDYDRDFKNSENYSRISLSDFRSYKSTITSPIWIENRLFGIINFDGAIKSAFTESDLDLLDYFSSQIGVIIKNHKQIEKAIYQSRFDLLTEIHNRSFFEEILTISMKQQVRQNIRFQMVLFDLDNFKEVNDSYGHLFGDKILKYFVNAVNDHIRESDLFARYGGDEFIAVFFVSSSSDAVKIISKIEKFFEEKPYRERSVEVFLKFSYGVASFPDEAVNYADLVHISDTKMYENKRRKKFKN